MFLFFLSFFFKIIALLLCQAKGDTAGLCPIKLCVPVKCFFLFFLEIHVLIYLLIDWLLCWVFVSVRALSPVAASGDHSSSRCAGLSLSRPLLLRSTGSRRAGSVVVAHGPSCSAARGIFPDQGSNPCPLHWQADSQPLRHQGSPGKCFLSLQSLDPLAPQYYPSPNTQGGTRMHVHTHSHSPGGIWGIHGSLYIITIIWGMAGESAL